MNHRRLLRLVLFVLVIAGSVGSFASPAAAHNSLSSSTPADGSALDVAPVELSMVFAKPVPLDTVSLEMIDAGGTRSDITAFAHGPSGDTEVVATLPALPPGEVTFRWKLVGADGHPITGRLSFTIATPPEPTIPPSAAVAASAVPVDTAPSDVAPVDTAVSVPSTAAAETSSIPVPSAADPISGVGAQVAFSDDFSTPGLVRWVLRAMSYVALLVIIGVIATAMWVWPSAWADDGLRRLVSRAHVAVGIAAFAQLLVVASDVAGKAPWSAFSGLDGALATDAGRAFALRIIVIAGLWAVLFVSQADDEMQRWNWAAGLAVVALATWAFAGHSKSMRWAWIGVPVDTAHHAAAGTWIGGLAIVGLIAIRRAPLDELAGIVPRFGRVAAVSVAVLVGTGVVQTLRLVGSPLRIASVAHGRWLLLKLVVLAALLWVADINRKRVGRRFGGDTPAPTERTVEMLRRAMGTELAMGALIMAITTSMVVSPPATAADDASSPARPATASTIPLDLPGLSDPAAATVVPAVESPAAVPSTGAAATGAPVVDPSAATPPGAPCTIAAPLESGATGDAVVCLQQALIADGLLAAPATGTFDEATKAAVEAFQTANALLADGVVGPVTGRKLGIWAEG